MDGAHHRGEKAGCGLHLRGKQKEFVSLHLSPSNPKSCHQCHVPRILVPCTEVILLGGQVCWFELTRQKTARDWGVLLGERAVTRLCL